MLLNQVYLDPENERRYRVVLEHMATLMLIDIDEKNAWPFVLEETALHSSGFELIDEPYPLPSVEEGSAAEAHRDEAYQTIAPLLDEYLHLFDKKERNQLIKKVLKQTDKSRLYVVRQLRRYWQRGMSPNALAPDYHRCGGKGQSRRKIQNKPGRKRSLTAGTGVIITDEIAELFELAIEGYFLKNEKFSVKAALDKANGLFKARYPRADEANLPTEAQFRYFYQTNYQRSKVIEKRTPRKVYEKDGRPLVSTAGYMNFGPGARYEIDATIADIYLVSDKDPDAIIGRPVVYLVKDVLSRMVAGLYVGLENPSWVAAMIAMANAFSDKVEFCREYGISIDRSQWPCIGIPAGIMADRGELLSRQADVLVNRFGIKLSNSRAYRGDDKAIVERHFNTLQAEFKPYVSGIVEPVNGKKRLGRRYELDAELSLKAFTEIVIRLVVHHNTMHVIKGYDFAPDMPEDLPAVPLELWNWGIQNRTGKLKPCDKDLVVINLLPYEMGSVSELGITFKGLHYTCQEALTAGWFDRLHHSRPSKVEISFDPRRTNTVYLRPDNSFESYWVCHLADRSRRFRDLSFIDAAGILKKMRKAEAGAKQFEDFTSPDVQEEIEAIVARERAKKTRSTKPNSERLGQIGENRRAEKEQERNRSVVRPPSSENESGKADVLAFKPKGSQVERSLDYPSLDEFLEDSDD